MGLRASHTHLHIRHALENFEEGQTGEVQEGTLRQLLDLRPQSTKSHNCIRLCTRYWNRQMVGLSNKKKNWWLQKIPSKILLHIFVFSIGGGVGARIFNGNKMDVKTEYTHAECGHESMFNPLVHCAAKECNACEGVRPFWKKKREPYLTTFRLDGGWQILVGTTS